MRFVYATRPLPKLEFATANRREALPDDAEVYAVCDGALTIRRHHEHTLNPLTDQEQAALEQLITNSELAEVADAQAAKAGADNLFRRIWRRLLAGVRKALRP